MPALDLPPLSGWTFQTVIDIVRLHEFEPGRFDYKAVLTGQGPQRDEVLVSIQRTSCSLANADGGYLLFGVNDRREQVRTPEQRIVGIPLGGDLRKQFGDKIQQIQPELHFEAMPQPLVLPSDASRGLFVVQIPLSPLRPHRAPDGIFYRRGDGGSAIAMSYYEVRDQMLFTEERRRKATLLRLEIAQYREQTASMLRMGMNITGSMLRFDTGAFKVLLAEVASLLPPGDQLLRELLQIPMLANLINEWLMHASYPGLQVQVEGRPDPNVERAQAIHKNLQALDAACTSCEQQLYSLLGPITGTPGP